MIGLHQATRLAFLPLLGCFATSQQQWSACIAPSCNLQASPKRFTEPPRPREVVVERQRVVS